MRGRSSGQRFRGTADRRVNPRVAADACAGLGCGSGDLLVQMGVADPNFVGWGIEVNPALCRAARARVRTACLTRRVHVIEGDSRTLGAVLPKAVRREVTGVTACQVANEMFRSGVDAAVAWLRGIRKTLPGRPVLINDYYGRLGTKHTGTSSADAAP